MIFFSFKVSRLFDGFFELRYARVKKNNKTTRDKNNSRLIFRLSTNNSELLIVIDETRMNHPWGRYKNK